MVKRKRTLFNLIPRSGNTTLDDLTQQGLQQAAGMVYSRLDPQAQQVVDTAEAALRNQPRPSGRSSGGTIRNPLSGAGRDNNKVRFMQRLMALRGGLIVWIGRRGSGKTAGCLRLAQEYQHQRHIPVFVVGMPQSVLTAFGFREIPSANISELPNNCVLVIDDVTIYFSNRDYDKAAALHRLLAECRHRGIIVIVNAHSSAFIDKYLLDAEVAFFKPTSGLTDDLQRSGIKRAVARSDAAFAQLSPEDVQSHAYAISDQFGFEGMISYRPPAGWSERVSTHHAEGRR